jgi:hypothetical protein
VKFHVLLCSYEMVSKHISDLARLNWGELIVDEGHRLKTKTSKLFQVGEGGGGGGEAGGAESSVLLRGPVTLPICGSHHPVS